MRTLYFIGVAITLCSMVNSTSAQVRDPSGPLNDAEKAINETPENADIQLGVVDGYTEGTYRAPADVPEAQGNYWRYGFQNSQWWYYQPNNRWVVWTGNRWVEPQAVAPNRTNATQQPQQSGYRGTQGITQQRAPQAAPAKNQGQAAAGPQTK